ncbi:hypothetical protein AB0L25_14885 [Spirillospora sp. NPDC052242]
MLTTTVTASRADSRWSAGQRQQRRQHLRFLLLAMLAPSAIATRSPVRQDFPAVLELAIMSR